MQGRRLREKIVNADDVVVNLGHDLGSSRDGGRPWSVAASTARRDTLLGGSLPCKGLLGGPLLLVAGRGTKKEANFFSMIHVLETPRGGWNSDVAVLGIRVLK